jgi:hypothetical protein
MCNHGADLNSGSNLPLLLHAVHAEHAKHQVCATSDFCQGLCYLCKAEEPTQLPASMCRIKIAGIAALQQSLDCPMPVPRLFLWLAADSAPLMHSYGRCTWLQAVSCRLDHLLTTQAHLLASPPTDYPPQPQG